ncbi:hypothetical protein QVD17_04953 [Tagetes erecta]|uniref:Uncharacterized protein n=1 Tax=Tagetes erecta TaxID=13708 RepID=A0AAD8LDL2_TARER|nr:hypothetical protein QVD17_04953 [Tagetes erecta]
MFSIFRSVSVQAKPTGSLIFAASQNVFGKLSIDTRSGRSHQFSINSGSPTSMDKIQHSQEPNQKGDVMSHSFEDSYTTRSDEEGFGGSFSGNESLSSKEQDKLVHANSPEYDKKTEGKESTEKREG